MIAVLLLCAFGVAAFVFVGVAVLVLKMIGALLWLVTLPLRILFKLVFGLGGVLFGLILAPFVAVIVTLGVVVALVGAVLSLFAPLLPIVLLGLFAWAIYRLGAKKPAPPPPMPGLWS